MNEKNEPEQFSTRFPQLSTQFDQFQRNARSDSRAAAICARILVEAIVKTLYSEMHLEAPVTPHKEKNDLFTLLKGLTFQTAIPENIQCRFHAIRIVGNAAAHEAHEIPQEKIDLVAQDLLIIRTWLCQYFHLTQEATLANDDAIPPSQLVQALELKDFYSQDTLTDDQSQLLNRLTSFLDSPEKKVFRLGGYAGTGKTFILKGLTQYLELKRKCCILLATTGKAARVFSAATGHDVKTVHSQLYGIPKSRDDLQLYFPLCENKDPERTIYIIDESSMIGDMAENEENCELLFGSGQLLSDLMQYTGIENEASERKIIFVGDDAQLPPMNMHLSPALSEQYLKTHFDITSDGFTLTQVVRQKADSGILKNAGALRESIDQNDYSHLSISTQTDDVIRVSTQDWLKSYLITCQHEINDDVVCMAHTNQKVNYYNQAVRSHFFPGCKTICAGDKVIVAQNNSLLHLFNGDMLKVKRVNPTRIERTVSLKTHQGKQSVTLRFCEVTLEQFDVINETLSHQDYLIFEDFLYRDKPRLTKQERQALEVDFKIRHPNITDPIELAVARQKDIYINALRLRFGYAITTHKAQGSQWPFAFVDCDAAMSTATEDYFRWLYTAFTRCQTKLQLINPRGLNQACENARRLQDEDVRRINEELQQLQSEVPGNEFAPWEDVAMSPSGYPQAIAQIDSTPHSETVLANAQEISESDPLVTNPASHEAVLAQANALGIQPEGMPMQIFRTLERALRHTDIRIESVQSHPWQEVYRFVEQNNCVDVDIWYNKKNKITRVQMRSHNALEEHLKDTLQKLTSSPDQTTFTFSERFLQELFVKVNHYAQSENVQISHIENQPWKQRYTFTYQNDSLRIDFFYNKRQQITKWAPVCPDDRNHPCFAMIERICNECLTR